MYRTVRLTCSEGFAEARWVPAGTLQVDRDARRRSWLVGCGVEEQVVMRGGTEQGKSSTRSQ